MKGLEMFIDELSGYFVIAPLKVPVSKNKDFTLNLNVYRNAHYQVTNKAKIAYKESIMSQIRDLPKFDKISLRLTLFPKTNRKTDIDNICAIHSKFFLDALVELGKLPDDNYDYVDEITFMFGGVDKEQPRVAIQIKEKELVS